jgi:hypothetical protein
VLALRHPVAASAPLGSAYGGLRNGKGKIKKQRLGKLFLIFFRFQSNLGHQLAAAMSNIQRGFRDHFKALQGFENSLTSPDVFGNLAL